MTAKPIKNETENWTQDYSTYFWSSSDPFEVKFEVEKTLGLLLPRVKTQTPQLTYSGSDNPPHIGIVEAKLGIRAWRVCAQPSRS